jgi:hypothetical protein
VLAKKSTCDFAMSAAFWNRRASNLQKYILRLTGTLFNLAIEVPCNIFISANSSVIKYNKRHIKSLSFRPISYC